jgi:ankyrin repeat protein
MAAVNRCIDMLDLLVEENPDCVAALDYNGNSPMHDAAKSFNHEAIHKLFELNDELCRGRNFKEQLPIHKAFGYLAADATRLQFRHLETIRALLKYNPETASLPDANDSLPLHLAVFYHSSIEVCTEIYNVYPSAALVRDAQGKLPIQYVNNAEVKKLLMRSSPPLVKAGITDSFSRFVTNG